MSSLITFRKFKGKQIPILTVPRGTCLFRAESEKMDPLTTFAGTLNPNTKEYNLNPNQNVYFYPYPYIIDPFLYDNQAYNIKIFCITRDIKVLLLLEPSQYKFFDPNDSVFLTCDNTEIWENELGNEYDYCFSKEFIKKNPDIVGHCLIRGGNMHWLRRSILLGKMDDFLPFMAFFKDRQNYTGVPEYVLYPQKERSLETIVRKIDEKDAYQWIYQNAGLFNYYPMMVIPHKIFQKDELYKAIQDAFSEKGYQIEDKNYKFAIDKRTYFYVFSDFVDEKDKPFLTSDLSILRKKNPELIFTYANRIRI